MTPSAVALGAATGRAADRAGALVLNVGPGGTELTAQAGTVPSAIRHLRGPSAPAADGPDDAGTPFVDKPFIGELRRTVSALPAVGNGTAGTGTGTGTGTGRELVLWGSAASAALDPTTLGQGLGLTVRAGELSALGVTSNGGAANGDGRTYAVAVALALSALGTNRRAVDFLHPRLAPPKPRLVPRWAILATLGTVAVVGGVVYAWQYLGDREATLALLKSGNDNRKPAKTEALAFVNKVTFAQAWQGGNPRYLDCYRDVTRAMAPLDDFGSMNATSLTIGETPRPQVGNDPTKVPEGPQTLTGSLDGHAPDQRRVTEAVRRLKELPAFSDVQLKNSAQGTSGGAAREVQFSYKISFIYTPRPGAGPLPPAATTPQPPAARQIATQPTTVPLR